MIGGILFLFVVQSSNDDWCLVQSSNQDDSITRTSYHSVRIATLGQHVRHIVYDCYGKGFNKPRIVLEACEECNNVIWVDSDVYVTRDFNLSIIQAMFKKFRHLSLITGVDFEEMIRDNRKLKPIYYDNFNDGTFAVRCSASMLLREWMHFAKHGPKDDQAALQLMASKGSLFSKAIGYDFQIFGVYSSVFKHYPDKYKSRMLGENQAIDEPFNNKNPCSLSY